MGYVNYDIGRVRTYNYHVGNKALESKVSKDVIEEWYPKSVTEQEYRILQKLKVLSNSMDGNPIELKNDIEIAAFYMTYDLRQEKFKAKMMYNDGQTRRSECCSRGKERFIDMQNRGLVGGRNFIYPFITMSGLKVLESVHNAYVGDIQSIVDELSSIQDYMKSNQIDIKLQSDISVAILRELSDLKQLLLSDASATNAMNIVNTACNTINTAGTISSIAPDLIKILMKVLKMIGPFLSGLVL